MVFHVPRTVDGSFGATHDGQEVILVARGLVFQSLACVPSDHVFEKPGLHELKRRGKIGRIEPGEDRREAKDATNILNGGELESKV